MIKLSVVIPAYNEEKLIHRLIQKVMDVPTESLGFVKEIIVVDDGSSDSTFQVASSFKNVKVLRQEKNSGKGSAVQRGVEASSGEYVLIQDADLEYDPQDYMPMLAVLTQNKDVAVYGSRTWGQWSRNKNFMLPGKHPAQGLGPWCAGVCLCVWTFLLYGKWLTDTLTAYKIYPAKVLKSLQVKTRGFETDHEITAKLIRRGISIQEVPIGYSPRSVAEGKKIRLRDGFLAVWTLLRFRCLL